MRRTVAAAALVGLLLPPPATGGYPPFPVCHPFAFPPPVYSAPAASPPANRSDPAPAFPPKPRLATPGPDTAGKAPAGSQGGPAAKKTPAPSARAADAPAGEPRAAVSEVRSFQVFAVAPGGSVKLDPAKVSTAFWNLTGADLALRVAGTSRVVPRGKSVTVETPRDFEWQIEGRPPEKQKVAATDAGVEIVIRQ